MRKCSDRSFKNATKCRKFFPVFWRVGQAVGASVCSLLVSALVKELSGAIGDLGNHDRQRLDSSLVYIGAHNVYYVKSCLSDAKCFSGSRYSFRVQELKPLLFHNWPVHGEIAWLFPAPC